MNAMTGKLCGLAVGMLLLSGCTVTISPPKSVEEDFSLSSSFDEVETLRIRWEAGDINVTVDDTATEITATGKKTVQASTTEKANEGMDDFEIVIESTESTPLRKTLRFEGPTVEGLLVAVADVEVTIPAGVALDIQNDAGDIAVIGNVGTTKIELDAGSVAVSQQVGDTIIEVNAGAISVGSTDGDVDVQIDAGTAEVAASPAEDGVIEARANAGSVEIYVPADFGADLDLRGPIGSVSVDLDPFDVSGLTVTATRIEATLNGGGGTITGIATFGSVEFGPRGS